VRDQTSIAHPESLAEVSKTRLTEHITEVKVARGKEIAKLSARHEQARQALRDQEKAKMKEAWRQAPQPERSKRGKSKAKDEPARRLEPERVVEERQHRRSRNRDRGRTR